MANMDEMDFNFTLGLDEEAPEEQTLMTVIVAKGLVSSETSFGKTQDDKDRNAMCIASAVLQKLQIPRNKWGDMVRARERLARLVAPQSALPCHAPLGPVV